MSLDKIPENPEEESVFCSSCTFDEARFKSEADFRALIGENKEPTSEIPTFQSDASFKNAVFDRGARFDNTNLSSNEDVKVNFLRSSMPHSSFQDSKLSNWLFTDADLTKSDFSGACLVESNLERANMIRVNLYNANLHRSMFYSAILSNIRIDEATKFGDHYAEDYEAAQTSDENDIKKSIWSSRAVERIAYANARSRQGRSAYFSRKISKED